MPKSIGRQRNLIPIGNPIIVKQTVGTKSPIILFFSGAMLLLFSLGPDGMISAFIKLRQLFEFFFTREMGQKEAVNQGKLHSFKT